MTDNRIFISSESVASKDTYDIIWSNIAFINALQQEFVTIEELSQDALRSYYVDYYLAQINNGGFAQFVYNSRWHPTMIGYVRDGLAKMGATRHLKLFEQSAAILNRFSPQQLESFFEGEFFGENQERDILNAFNSAFYSLNEQEDLIVLNSRWLQTHPERIVLPQKELEVEVTRRAAAIPNREERLAQARADEPRYYKLVRALCAQTGQVLNDITAGSPETYEEQNYLAWHFLTDQGHHYMIDTGTEGLMFNDASKKPIATFPIPVDFGD